MHPNELRKLESRLDPRKQTRASLSVTARLRRVLAQRLDALATRLMDIFVAAGCLLLFVPAGVAIALLIRLDGGPVLYWQDRIGLHGRIFRFPKFRSMVVNADALRKKLEEANEHGGKGVTFKLEDDPRITRIGRFLRRTSLDELPQLWNVLRGDMALVGPRPALPTEVARYTPEQRRRLEIKPGLTCLWQIRGRSQIPFDGQVKLDIEYIRTRNFVGDVLILIKTVPAVIFGRGAS
jgi:lipopolysaccharide/colanic/teichoic acid biosynthesis glycosyltransferase